MLTALLSYRPCVSPSLNECFRALLIKPIRGGPNTHICKCKLIKTTLTHCALNHEFTKDYKSQTLITYVLVFTNNHFY